MALYHIIVYYIVLYNIIAYHVSLYDIISYYITLLYITITILYRGAAADRAGPAASVVLLQNLFTPNLPTNM